MFLMVVALKERRERERERERGEAGRLGREMRPTGVNGGVNIQPAQPKCFLSAAKASE